MAPSYTHWDTSKHIHILSEEITQVSFSNAKSGAHSNTMM